METLAHEVREGCVGQMWAGREVGEWGRLEYVCRLREVLKNLCSPSPSPVLRLLTWSSS